MKSAWVLLAVVCLMPFSSEAGRKKRCQDPLSLRYVTVEDEPVASSSPTLDPHMEIFLIQSGYPESSMVRDASAIKGRGFEQRLVQELGFKLKSTAPHEPKTYTNLIHASLNGPGQRVIFHENGSVELVTIAQSKQHRALFQETILISSDNAILNSTIRLPSL